MNLSNLLPHALGREIAEQIDRAGASTVRAMMDAINAATPLIARAVLEAAATHLDSMHERIVDGWNSFTEERADGAHNALRNAAKELRQMAKELSDAQ